jgi:phthiocerol/phenolphthiocerol synthesis type-I polyketide synthase E
VRRIAVTGAATGAIDEADIDTQIAVVGMACRFPGSRTPEEYWHNLVHGVDSIRDITARELAEWGEDPARLDEPRYVAAHGVVEGGGGLDARFFGITDRDAALLNPQHKVFLELAWEALERAGYDPRDAPEPVGVFAGTSRNGYGLLVHSLPDRFPGIDDVDLSLANEPEHLVTRVSYLLGLTGPSLAVQTACSTSLVAVHEASRALIGGECDTALAGGVSLRLPLHGYWHRGGGTMSPDGRCRAFSADARGIVGGDGAGVVVLRRLQDALEDGDHVHAVLLGTAVNNDGRHRAGYAAPGVRGQAEVVRSAHLAAGVTSSSVSYIEAHGTGTPVGDPIEVAALTQAFADHDGSAPVAIGSVKTNIGHTDAAAGVASLIKTVLALENQTLPATLHFDQPNPRIDFSDGLFVVNSATRVWTTGHLPRRAGVSSFGIGGTNAHAVLEAAPAPAGDKAAWGPEAHLLVLSARTPTALRAASARLAGHLRDHPEQSLGDIAHTLQRGRHAFGHRRHVVCAGRDDAVRAFTADSAVPAAEAGTDPSAVFVFPSGSQDGGEPLSIARLLTAATGLTFFSAFRAAVDTCHEALEHTGLDLLGLWPADETAGDGLPERAALLFAVEYATACLLRDWDVVPAAVTGYGTGALVAACVSGALPLADAVTLAVGPEDDAQRGEAIRKAPWTSPAIPVADPATGTLLTPQQAADGTAWAARLSAQPEDRGLPSAVRALRALAEQPQSVLLEVGPGRVLTDTAHRDGLTASAEILPCLPHVLPDGNTLPDGNAGADERGLVSLLDAAGRLWVAGARIRWEGLHEGARRRRVPLPTYPFERQEYLVRPAPWSAAAPAEPAAEDQEPLSVRDGLRTLFQQVLGVPEDVEDPDFFAYGGDSLSAVSLLALVEARFGAALDMEDVFTQATVGALAAVIEERLGAGADPVESS